MELLFYSMFRIFLRMKKRAKIVLCALSLLGCGSLYAHEPLYGLGPHVLFKGGFAPHFTFLWFPSEIETEYALGYGVTKRWTTIVEAPFLIEGNNYKWNGLNFKNKYRFWMRAKPGSISQVSAFSNISLPKEDGKPKKLNLSLTGGQESLKLFWFASAGYVLKFSDNNFRQGNHAQYHLALGYRPIKVQYFKPDIVFFVETTGESHQKSKLNNDVISQSGGHILSVAPSFFLTYRNVALRGGVQFGVLASKYISKPKTNFKLTIEMHI